MIQKVLISLIDCLVSVAPKVCVSHGFIYNVVTVVDVNKSVIIYSFKYLHTWESK